MSQREGTVGYKHCEEGRTGGYWQYRVAKRVYLGAASTDLGSKMFQMVESCLIRRDQETSSDWARLVRKMKCLLMLHELLLVLRVDIVIITIIVSFMQGIHTHIPETSHVPRGYIFAAILCFIHSFSILSDDRSKASSKTIPQHSAIYSFLLQMRVSSPVLKVIH